MDNVHNSLEDFMSGYLLPVVCDWKNNNGEIINTEDMTHNNEKITIINYKANNQNESPFIILDFGRKTTGYLFLDLEEVTPGVILNIEYGPLKNLMPQSKIIKVRKTSDRWIEKSYTACQFMKISFSCDTLENCDENFSITIKRIGLVFSAFPCVWSGSFQSEDKTLNDIWSTGAYTVQLCMQKNTDSSKNNPFLPVNNLNFIETWKSRYSQYVIFDGPRRDRETWLGDIRTEALAILTAFSSSQAVKSSLEIFMDLQRCDGTTPGCGSSWQEFKEYNLWWVVSVWECYLFTEDKAFLDHLYPGVKSFLNWMEFSLDERGFIFNDGNWMWTLPREGYSSATQCILYYTLLCAANIEHAMGNFEDENKYKEIANKTRHFINREFWDESKGVYIDHLKLINTRIPVMSDVNCYAVTFGIATPDKHDRIFEYLRQNMWTPYGSATLDYKITEVTIDPTIKYYALLDTVKRYPDPNKAIVEYMYPHNRMIWPFINGYEVESRFVGGDVEGAFELIDRCWGNMVYGYTGTFWECVDADTGEFPIRSFFLDSEMDCYNSAAHGWSGWISYILQTYVLGIRPLTPGFKKTIIEPNPGRLKKVSGTMPTPHGLISVTIEKTISQFILTIDRPLDVDCIINVSDKSLDGLELVVIEKCNSNDELIKLN